MHRAVVDRRARKAARQNLAGHTDQGCSPFLGNKISHKVTPCPSVPDRKQTPDSCFSLNSMYLVNTVYVCLLGNVFQLPEPSQPI